MEKSWIPPTQTQRMVYGQAVCVVHNTANNPLFLEGKESLQFNSVFKRHALPRAIGAPRILSNAFLSGDNLPAVQFHESGRKKQKTE